MDIGYLDIYTEFWNIGHMVIIMHFFRELNSDATVESLEFFCVFIHRSKDGLKGFAFSALKWVIHGPTAALSFISCVSNTPGIAQNLDTAIHFFFKPLEFQ